MANVHPPYRAFWLVVAILAALAVAGYVAFVSGALAIWLDPDPETHGQSLSVWLHTARAF